MSEKYTRIEALETLASNLVGDGDKEDLFFVTDRGDVVTVTRNFWTAYNDWKQLSRRSPRVECSLENRTYGVICDVSSDEETETLCVRDDSQGFVVRSRKWSTLGAT